MGKFDGMLLVSDYDNTLRYTEGALRGSGEVPPPSGGRRRRSPQTPPALWTTAEPSTIWPRRNIW